MGGSPRGVARSSIASVNVVSAGRWGRVDVRVPRRERMEVYCGWRSEMWVWERGRLMAGGGGFVVVVDDGLLGFGGGRMRKGINCSLGPTMGKDDVLKT